MTVSHHRDDSDLCRCPWPARAGHDARPERLAHRSRWSHIQRLIRVSGCGGTLLTALLLAACLSTPPSPETRAQGALNLAQAAGWRGQVLPSSPFRLFSMQPAQPAAADVLTVYIEGDGLAWLTRSLPSPDPTPVNPVALKLALKHESGAAAWLARPCQYVQGDNRQGCEQAYWTGARFSPEVVRATDQAVSLLKARFGATQLELVGYSGGGAVAALVAAGRQDVRRLITVAGNLDHLAWSKGHRISPLHGSLNPADYHDALQGIEQLHLVGAKDRIVGKNVAESFRSRFPVDQEPAVRIIEGFGHACCWSEHWPELIQGITPGPSGQ